ncbi:hypothetical protein NKR23_g1648 [Pleurostoma richardsiae]|uniref:Uncharacterized protein n=1 Tax=Pleurostoma richardsiae TaxID=41990 RepID=A0AA38S3N1_9PEZI|nr:hypothetical protein NKR23_g1648 [Pleurostoma richardsiae]
MADTIRDGLFWADRALAPRGEDPERLDRERFRFSESPPSYRSRLSTDSIPPQSPNPPSDRVQCHEERRRQLIEEHHASFPDSQFKAQYHEEYERLFKPAPGSGCVVDGTLMKLARETIKKDWIEQGIWNEEWRYRAGLWKHEQPLQLESESESESETEVDAPVFLARLAKRRRPKSPEELRKIAERRAYRGGTDAERVTHSRNCYSDPSGHQYDSL